MIFGYIDPGVGITIVGGAGGVLAIFLGFFGGFLLLFKKIRRGIKKWRRQILIFILLAITILGTIGGLIMRRTAKFDKKIIILGFDGLSPEILEPLMEDGKLPNFSRLKTQGTYSRLKTTNPSQSPVAWSGFSTGQNPGKHGVFDFMVRDPKTYNLNLSLSSYQKGKPQKVIKGKCFWEHTSEKRIPTNIITCPITFPPEKIFGRMLSGMGVPDILGTEGTFTFYTTESLNKNKDIGGKVFQVNKNSDMSLKLVGPRVAGRGGEAKNVEVPFKVVLFSDKGKAIVKYQNKSIELKKGQWSNWQEVTFNLSFFKKAKGIFKFYLVETKPEFKLYISPINFDPRNPLFNISYPRSYSRQIAQNIGLYYTQGMPMQTWAVNEGRLDEAAFLEETERVLGEKKAMLDMELKRFKKGLLFCYFESPDIIQHMFWRYIDPKHPLYEENAPEEYKSIIENWYIKMDKILGDAYKKISPDDILIVLSDHGFDTFRRVVHVNAWLRQEGYLELKNPHVESGAELLLDIDWLKTKAYSIGFGAIYINQVGREAKGIVKPGQETELLKKEISDKLKQFKDQKYNQLAISSVYPREDIFWGPFKDQTPDLYIGFNKSYRASWQSALGGVPNKIIEDNLKKWSGSHLFDPQLIPGILFCNRKITKKRPSIYDITPTILDIVGYTPEELGEFSLDGEPLF